MATSANLPAGLSITSISGIRCSAVPKTAISSSSSSSISTSAQATTAAAAAVAAAVTSQQVSSVATTSAAPPLVAALPDVVSSTSAAPTPAPTTTAAAQLTSSSIQTSSIQTSSIQFTAISSVVDTTSQAPPVLSSSSSIETSDTPTSSLSIVAIAQSEVTTTPAPSLVSSSDSSSENVHTLPSATSTKSSITSISTTNTAAPVQSSGATDISSNSGLTAAPVVGGVVGALALIGIIGVVFWCLRKRKRTRGSFLTPLTSATQPQFYGIDESTPGPPTKATRWGGGGGAGSWFKYGIAGFRSNFAGIGATLKSKVTGDRSDTPSVNLNRGNSQFLDGPIAQHSRNNSVMSAHNGALTLKDRITDYWERFTENANFNWRLRKRPHEPHDPFAAARGMTDTGANSSQPDFSKLLRVDDRATQLQAELRRTSLSTSVIPSLGNLGIDFATPTNPFVDPVPSKSQNEPWKPQKQNAISKALVPSDPFADPIAQPEPTIPNTSSYINSLRRSRGQSVNTTKALITTTVSGPNRPPSTAPPSRYPSSIAPSRDSYRDTVLSSFSAAGNARKGKGRSDPFDLERPELWRPKIPAERTPSRPRGSSNAGRISLFPDPLRMSSFAAAAGNANPRDGTPVKQPRIVSTQNPNDRIVSAAGTYASKYSSGTSLSDWGDPGPDLGPGIKGAVSAEEIGRQLEGSRNADNVSPMSIESEAGKGSVGKAM
ncbi:hypothetical protein B7494_g4312 [Chlorociboria aeruginascens]|nr:hypothetical protein B7494_g4312 [Chlorociboria aeruginascens]